jgi:glycosyltransferase involved in cell wall biosynthesis
MSVYNTPFALVKRAMDSVLQQDYRDFELIVIDDGSTSGEPKEILKYAIKHQDKITFLRHQNCGQSESINKGVLISSGEFITIIDADDEYKPSHLSGCLAEMNSFDLIASSTETIVDQVSDYYVPDRFDTSKVVHVDKCIMFATLFGKKEVFTSLKFYDMYGADANFYERAQKQFLVQKLDLRTYVYYRNNPNSLTATVKLKSRSND